MMKNFRNAFLVTAVASATLLGWGCKERGQGEPVREDQAGQQGTGGAGGTGEDLRGTESGTGSDVEGSGGTGGAGGVDESGDMGPGREGEEILQEDTGGETGSEPDMRR